MSTSGSPVPQDFEIREFTEDPQTIVCPHTLDLELGHTLYPDTYLYVKPWAYHDPAPRSRRVLVEIGELPGGAVSYTWKRKRR